jgi:hypothetical protein
LVLSEAFVLEVGVLELGADVDGGLELMGSIDWFLLKECEDLGTRDVFSGLLDDGIADLSNEDNQSGWGVVVLGVLPDQENSVHNRNKEVV